MANLNYESLNSSSKPKIEQTGFVNATGFHSSLPTLTVKLVEKNYTYWRSQILSTLASHELDGFLTASKQGSIDSLPQMPNSSGTMFRTLSNMVQARSSQYQHTGPYSQNNYNAGTAATMIPYPHFTRSALGLGNSRGVEGVLRSPYSVASQFFTPSAPLFNTNVMKGRGRRCCYFKPKLVCQVCGKSGHSTLQCYKRFDHGYQGFTTPTYSPLVHASTYSPSVPISTPFPGSSKYNMSVESAHALFITNVVPFKPFHPSYAGFDLSAFATPKSSYNGLVVATTV